jgi:hypothetical protein
MKHKDLKVGMKLRRTELSRCKDPWLVFLGNIVTVCHIGSEAYEGFNIEETEYGYLAKDFEPVVDVTSTKDDAVNHPKHYTSKKGIECIQVTEQFNFNKGNAIKYVWRSGEKGNEVEDLKKAKWYIDREIEGLENK